MSPHQNDDALRVSADIGGTFTDIALFLPNGRLVTRKVLSTPADYSLGVVTGLAELCEIHDLRPSDFSEVLHGCTVATNAILEMKGARTALITTRGFRDVLELRRIRIPKLYDALYLKPSPLVPRNLRLEVTERLAVDGSVVTALDEDDVSAAIETIRRARVEAVAVCFLHSYVNDEHERRVGQMLREALPNCFISLSVDVLPEIREYERTSTTVINAYVGPPVAKYIRGLRSGLVEAGFPDRLLVMQSSGGTLEAEAVTEFPARIVECGPAAGVIGAAHSAALAGYGNAITFDMGGTTAKASLIENGQITRTDEYEVGGGISVSSRLLKGGGYALKLPVIDISEVGAGGGSIVRLDKAGAVKVGPDSAGAQPGPACYGAGGTLPTVTDANVVLGFINPRSLAGGSVAIDEAAASTALQSHIGDPLGIPVEDAAWSVFVVAAANMMRAVKAVSTYRGRDPSEFVLIAFGGNGGIFASELLRQLQMQRAIIPPAAGVLSAVGLLVGDVQFSKSQALLARLDKLDPTSLAARLDELAVEVRRKLPVLDSKIILNKTAAMRYAGQAFELRVPIPSDGTGRSWLAALQTSFEEEHQRTYGHRLDGFATELVAVEVSAIGAGAHASGPPLEPMTAPEKSRVFRRLHFGPRHGWHQAPVCTRSSLGFQPLQGPLVIEDYEGTTVVPPDASAALDDRGNILLDLKDDIGNEKDASRQQFHLHARGHEERV
jgi:N-methylhydantoinase A